MDKFIIDLVHFCNEIDKFNNNKSEKINKPSEPYNTIQKIKNDLTLSFNEQAKLLWNINIPTTKQQPYSNPTQIDYRTMTIYQINYYLYWRTMLRQNKLMFIDFPYLKLYIYELIAVTTNPNITLEALKNFYDKYPYSKEQLKIFLKSILKDYFLVFNDKLKCSYEEVFKMFNITYDISNEDISFFNNNYNINISYYNSHSSYKILNSKFYATPIGKKTTEEVMPYIWNAISKYFSENNLNLSEIIFGKYIYYPHLIFREVPHMNFNYSEKTVILNEFEKYTFINKNWNSYKRRNYNTTSNFFAYILKYTEMKLREYSKFKNKITVNKSSIILECINNKTLSTAIASDNFEKTIDNAIKDYLSTIIKKKDLTFNTDKIQTIKTITAENEEKLKVEEYEENKIIEEKIEPTIKENNSFISSLSNTEKQVIKLLLSNSDIKEFLSSQNIMPETILESINEKALDYFGDNLIDTLDEPYIYEDYISELKGD
jgi:hypothetical protein